MSGSEESVLVGRIVKPHGIRGEVVVESLSDVPGRFDAGARFSDQRGNRFVVASSRPHQGRLLVRFEDVPDRNQAERLRGVDLFGEPILEDASDTYYVHEIIGMAVASEDDQPLGTVRDVIDLPSAAGYDLLEVERADGTTWLLPAVDELVEVVLDEDTDEESLRLRDTPEGLLEEGRS